MILLDETIYHISLHDGLPPKNYWYFCGKRLRLERSGNIFDYERDYFTDYQESILPFIEEAISDGVETKKTRLATAKSNIQLAVNKRYVDFIVNRVFAEYRAKGDVLEKYGDEYLNGGAEIITEVKKTQDLIEPDIYETFLASFFQNNNSHSGWDLLKNKNFAVIDEEYYDLVESKGYNREDYVEIGGRRYSLLSNTHLPIGHIEKEYQQTIERRIHDIVLNKDNGLLKDIQDLDKEEKLLELAGKKEYEEEDGLGFIRGQGHYAVFISDLKLRRDAITHYCPGVEKPRVATNLTLDSHNHVNYTAPYFVGGQGFPCHGGWNMASLRNLNPDRQVAMVLYHGKRMAERIEFRNGNLVMGH